MGYYGFECMWTALVLRTPNTLVALFLWLFMCVDLLVMGAELCMGSRRSVSPF